MATNKLKSFYIFPILSLMLNIFIMISCGKKQDYPVEPVLTFESLSTTTLTQGLASGIDSKIDSVLVRISFTDGDGDLGNSIKDTMVTSNIIIIDNRTDFEYTTFKLNAIPEEGANNGVNGTIELRLLTTCCIFPDLIPPCTSPVEFPENKLSFDIYMIDRAGHKSNIITTPEITLLCQ